MISQDDYDDETKSIWAAYLNMVVNGIALLDNEALPVISETCVLNRRLIFDHFADEIDTDAWTRNEEKLGTLFTIIDGDDDQENDDDDYDNGNHQSSERRADNYVY